MKVDEYNNDLEVETIGSDADLMLTTEVEQEVREVHCGAPSVDVFFSLR